MSIIRMFKAGCVIALALLMTGCSLLSPVKVVEPYRYFLNSAPGDVARHKRHDVIMLVLAPETVPAYNTNQMAYTVRPFQVAYFAHNEWAETPSQMLQPLITQTLQNTHYYRAIVGPGYVGRYDYVLYVQILELKQDFTHQPATLNLQVRAQVVNTSTNEVKATREFTVHQPMLYNTPYSGVVAANKATREMLRELAAFCVRNSR